MENDLVLFSPVGTTDPITNCRDGALLHICRAYRPREVWLYLSDEMLRYHQSDDRYLACLNRLGEETGWSFRARIIPRPGCSGLTPSTRTSASSSGSCGESTPPGKSSSMSPPAPRP